MKLRILVGLCLLSFCVPGAVFAATVPSKNVTPVVSQEAFVPLPNEFAAAIVMVPGTHQVLYGFKPDQVRSVASLTKLANALAFIKTGPSWNRIVALSSRDEVGGGRLRIRPGDRLSVRDLFYSAITASANNAAMAMARISGLSYKAYLAKMNKEAKLAGATKSNFVDPAGMQLASQSTARDMARIAEKAFQNPMIHAAAIVGTYKFPLRNKIEVHTIKATNRLLTDDPDVWVTGGKTGYYDAYHVAVQMQPVDENGVVQKKKEVIVVVLGAPNKGGEFSAAKRLAQWAWKNYEF